WEEGLAAAGIELARPGQGPVDLAVGPASHAAAVIAAGAELTVIEGRGGARWLRRGGYRAGRFLPFPGMDAPELLLPLGRSAPVAAALGAWKATTSPAKRARNAGFAWL